MIDSLEIERIRDPQKRIIMVIGSPDSGKTSIVWFLAKLLVKYMKTAIVDLDMGQSRIGPPTTIGWAMMEDVLGDWSEMKIRGIYFTGTVTPFGSLLPAVTGAKLMTERALNLAEKVLIDTTGFISEPAGRILKQFKIDIIEPDIILAIESSDELFHILDPVRFNIRPDIIRLPVPSEVRIKTQAKRGEYRFERMMDYLSGAGVIDLSNDRIRMRFIKNPIRFKGEFIDRVVSLRDRCNRDIAIGVIKGLSGKVLKILTPLKDAREVTSIIIGKTVIDIKNRTLKDS